VDSLLGELHVAGDRALGHERAHCDPASLDRPCAGSKELQSRFRAPA
jgi:hypothetical protein